MNNFSCCTFAKHDKNMSSISKYVTCPNCQSRLVPVTEPCQDGILATRCQQCDHRFKFRGVTDPRGTVAFTVNGQSHTLSNQFEASMTLNEYLRDVAHLTGTKVMCREGGCGCCVVSAQFFDPVTETKVTKAINSCLCPVYRCDGWVILTTEGLGDKKSGYHPIQERLALHNGSQCGFCSPGMVMNMYSFLQEFPKASKSDIESAFDGNLCRCTGFRPILDAMETFAPDAPSGPASGCLDIEDLKCSPGKSCEKSCEGSCQKNRQMEPLWILSRGAEWLRPTSLSDLYTLLRQHEHDRVKLVVGNTSVGLFKNDRTFTVFIDLQAVSELNQIQEKASSVTFGANVTLSKLITELEKITGRSGFHYCDVIVSHLRKVASTPVRNVASWAGNMMVKHLAPGFPSDVFLLLETIAASIVIGCSGVERTMTPLQFLQWDMTSSVILRVSLHPLSQQHRLQTYKIMPRSQNALAYVNAGVLMKLDDKDNFRILEKPSIVYGGVNPTLVHACATEKYLTGRELCDPKTLEGALDVLSKELDPDEVPGGATPEYKHQLALALFYRYVLWICGSRLNPRLRTGGLALSRPLSTGVEGYGTDKSKWPLTEPMTKVMAKQQAAGEAQYVPDMFASSGQLFAAFVVTSVGNAKIQTIDASEALSQDGVVRFLSAPDIPGANNFVPDSMEPEELFCSGQVLYAGQAVGIVVADTQVHADEAAKKVKVAYSDVKQPITDIREAVERESFFPKVADDYVIGDAEAAIASSAKVVTGEVAMGTQYHFNMETQSCLCVPQEEGLALYPTTQWVDGTQQVAARCLDIPSSQIYVEVRRVGGAYGGKISRNGQVSAACALAAFTLNRPVKMHMDFTTNMALVGRRFPHLAKYKVGVTEDATLAGIQITYFADCGCSPNDTSLSYMQQWADNAYFCENWRLVNVAVRTNTPSNTWCRSPGSAPAVFVIETILDHVARELGLDPTAVRITNMYRKGQMCLLRQPLPYCNIRDLTRDLLTSCEFESRSARIKQFNEANRWKKLALSLVPIKFGAAWNGAMFSAMVTVLNGDGSVTVTTGGVELGQGLNTKVQQVCAYELGISMELVRIRPADTVNNPNVSSTGGSISSELCCRGVVDCCKTLNERFAPVRAKLKDPTWQELVAKCYQQELDLTARSWVAPSTEYPCEYFAYGATCTEIQLDVLTGEHQIQRVDMLYDVGESTNPEIDMGQAQGAFVMGLGYYLMEEIKYDVTTGKNTTASTWGYHPPTTKDIPIDFRVQFLRNAPNPKGVLGAKIIGEPPLCMSCSALLAVKHAVEAARADLGRHAHFTLDAPATVERTLLACLPNKDQFIITRL